MYKLLLKIDYVRVTVPQVHYTVTSEDVPGLTLAGDTYGEAITDLYPAIKILFELNKRLKVEVWPLRDEHEDQIRHLGETDGYHYYVAVVEGDPG